MNNDTTVNVNIGANDASQSVINGAANNFAGLWKSVAEGQIVANVVQQGFDMLVQSIQYSISTAGDYQMHLTQLVTGAGEAKSNLTLVSDGLDQVAIQTGTTLDQLTSGAYLVESAGFHGANAINIMHAAAEASKADGAQIATVSDALTTILRDYSLGGDQAVSVTNQMIAAVAQGKMRMEDFAGSLSTVLPAAHDVGLSFAEVAGAEATLTAGGVTANQATQDLNAVIRAIQKPTQQQTTAMQQMGLSSLDLSKNLGEKGLTGTLGEISKAITQHMGPDGLILQNALQNSQVAARDAQKEIAAMPANLQKMAEGFLNGTVNLKDWRTAIKDLPPLQANLMQQFAATADKTNSFNKALKTGGETSQTFYAALTSVLGQQDAANAAMLLGGKNAEIFGDNVKKIGDAAKGTGKDINDWAEIQNTFNQKWSEFQSVMQVSAQKVGESLLPALSATIDWLMKTGVQLGDWWNGVARAMQPAVDFFNRDIAPILVAVGKIIADQLVQAWNDLVKAVQPFMPWLKQAGELLLILLGAIVVVAAIISVVFIGALLALIVVGARVIGWIAEFISWFERLPGMILSAVGKLADLLFPAGRDLINGLINGVKSMIGEVGDTIKNVAKSAVDGIKGLLGIHSPSTVFADIGENMGQGLINGLKGIQAQANVAVTGLVTGAPILGSGSGSSVSNNTTNYHSTTGGSTQTVNIGQLTVQLPPGTTAAQFFTDMNQDTLNLSKGLSVTQGVH